MRRRASIRLRLAAWCAALVTVSGTIVVLGVLALTGQVLHDRAPRPATPPPPGSTAPAPVPAPAGPAALGTPAAARPGPTLAADNRQGDTVSQTLSEARLIGLGVLGVLALASVGIGWVVAARMLRPLTVLAGTARQVSEATLHRRIALDGPRDELRELADTLDAMLDRLDRGFAAQRRFVADASHELRTPLAAIRAEAEAVLEDPAASPAARRAATDRITAVLDRAERLLDALLTLSRSEAIEARERVDLAELVGEVTTAIPRASELDLDARLGPAEVLGDALLLGRLAGNLVENAVRYNVPGGRLIVATDRHDGVAHFTVVNDGPPVDPIELPLLVERFHRTAARTGGGFGLGLSIADAVARGLGGRLELAARPAGGMEVTVTLPAAPALGSSTSAGSSSAGSAPAPAPAAHPPTPAR